MRTRMNKEIRNMKYMRYARARAIAKAVARIGKTGYVFLLIIKSRAPAAKLVQFGVSDFRSTKDFRAVNTTCQHQQVMLQAITF